MTGAAPQPVMDAVLQKDYELLQNEVGALGYRLGEFTTIFAPVKRRVELLNSVAGVFFHMLHETLWADMLMHLGRLTDPAKQGAFENLSIHRLPLIVDPACRATVQEAVDAADRAAAFAREGRNKIYAHRDLIVVRDPQNAGFDLGSVTQMRDAIGHCEAVLDTVARHYVANRGTYFHDIRIGIADDMIRTLEAGDRARYAERAAAMQSMIDAPAAQGGE